MEPVQEGLVEIVDANQKNDIAEVIVTPCRQLELDELWQRDDLNVLDLLGHLRRIGERERTRLATAGKSSGDQNIELHGAFLFHKPPGPAFNGLVKLGSQLAPEAIQSLAC